MAGLAITAEEVKRRAADLGFTLSGIAPAIASEHADHVRRWLAAGRHGSMAYLEKNLELRLSPQALLPGARTVISVADYLPPTHDRSPHQVGETPEQQSDKVGGVARYAQYDDYHRIIKKRLHRLADDLQALAPDEHFRACVDTAPVLEREHAARAGLGWVGKNTMLIHPQLGSHLMLGELLTTLDLPPDTIESDHCGSCTRCIDACPTQCITPYEIDASRCVSYLTIEHRESIAPDLHEPLGDHLFGCDVCQDVCPYNQPSRLHRLENAGAAIPHTPPDPYAARPSRLDVLDVLGWDEAARREAFTRSAMKRAKLDQMKRNALLVAANYLRRSDDPALLARIKAIATTDDEPPLVKQTAEQILKTLSANR